MENPLITIFIPTYRRPFLVKRAIESALNQTVKDLIVFVSDNASNDETSEIVSEIAKKDPRVYYVCHSKNIGMLSNYEFCLSNIKTKYFCILSDDDMLMPCFCELALEEFHKFPEIAFFAGSSLMVRKGEGVFRVPLDNWPREGLFNPPEGFLEMIGKYPIPNTVLYRTSAIADVKIDFQNNVAWDCDFLLQIASRFPIAISKKPCGFYVYHPHSFAGDLTFGASLDSVLKLITRVREFSWIDPATKAQALSLLREDYFAVAKVHLWNYLFGLKRPVKGIQLCFKLFTKGYRKKSLFIYTISNLICLLIPFSHQLISFLIKLKNALWQKKPDHDDEMCKKYSHYKELDLQHLDEQSTFTLPRKSH